MKYNIEINHIRFDEKAMFIGWSCENIGFGVLTVIQEEQNENKYEVQTEHMGRKFYEQVLEEAKKCLLNNSKIVE